MKTIALNIFTNCHDYAPDTGLVETTYNSFVETFGVVKTIVWCDTHPNTNRADEYVNRLSAVFPDVRVTSSLSDGYIQSIKEADTDYLFQLEGDWVFRRQWISHSLDRIVEVMDWTRAYHFRFNKRPNVVAGWDKVMSPYNIDGVKYCVSNNMSNNPHIIDVDFYNGKEHHLIEKIKLMPGSKGIEECLNKYGLYSHVYGGAEHPATIEHLDGRKTSRNRKKIRPGVI